MKSIHVLAFCLFLAIAPSSSHAADNIYWYEFTVGSGNSTQSFVGSSTLDGPHMAMRLSGNEAIALQNLRSFGNRGDGFRWAADREGETLFLRPDKILYFYLLTAEPVNPPSKSP